LLEDGMTIGEFISRHNTAGSLASGGLGETWHARHYLRFMTERGFLELPGEVFTRRPRRSRAMLPLSRDLGQFTFGVEYEVIMRQNFSRELLATEISTAGLRTRALDGVDHSTWTCWTVARDQSLPRFSGAEIKSPVLQGAGLEQAEAMARHLKKLRCRVSVGCGLHVHVGVKDENADFFRNILRLYRNNENWINQLVPNSRRHNRFCTPIILTGVTDTATKEEILRATGSDYNQKFKKLSTHCYARLGTIEFRQAAGTVEADKMSYWVKFCLRMCLAAKANVPTTTATGLRDLLERIGATEDEKTFLLRRAAQLNGVTP
jgi:hypothetical protein